MQGFFKLFFVQHFALQFGRDPKVQKHVGKLNATIIQRQADSLAQLNTALSAKDEILKRRETQHQAELKAARGSRLARLARVVECVASGVVIGAVLR